MGGDIRDAMPAVMPPAGPEIIRKSVQRIMELSWFRPGTKEVGYIAHDILRRRYRTQFIAAHMARK